jgi:hypothetical protein
MLCHMLPICILLHALSPALLLVCCLMFWGGGGGELLGASTCWNAQTMSRLCWALVVAVFKLMLAGSG